MTQGQWEAGCDLQGHCRVHGHGGGLKCRGEGGCTGAPHRRVNGHVGHGGLPAQEGDEFNLLRYLGGRVIGARDY